jgi:hypothetical protein
MPGARDDQLSMSIAAEQSAMIGWHLPPMTFPQAQASGVRWGAQARLVLFTNSMTTLGKSSSSMCNGNA